MSEQSIASARASVMIYDEPNKKWIPSGSSSGVSKVHIYQHVVNNSYRVVGRKLHDQEVVINCAILKGLKYNQATPTFHQWRDNRQVYGLSFSSKDDAEAFAYSMMHAVEQLNNGLASNGVGGPPMPPPSNGTLGRINSNPGIPSMVHQQQQQQQPPPQMPVQQQQPPPQQQMHHQPPPQGHPMGMPHQMLPQPMTHVVGHEADDRGYQTMTREDIAYIQERRMSQPQQQMAMPSLSSPNTPVVNGNGVGHHRTNSAPQPPPPPPPMGFASAPSMPPMMNGGGGGGPPPPPPPMPNGPLSNGTGSEPGGLAAALASASLRKTNRVVQPDAISTTSTSSSSSSGSACSGNGIYGTLRGGRTNGVAEVAAAPAGGGNSLMDEMQKTLARRRAMVKENSAPNVSAVQGVQQNGHNSHDDEDKGKKGESSSPKMNQRKRTGSDTSSGIVVNGNGGAYDGELEALKQDILKEVRKELYKIKAEIIDAIKIELNRR